MIVCRRSLLSIFAGVLFALTLQPEAAEAS